MSSQCANSQRKTQMTLQNTLSWSRALDTVHSAREQLHGLICCVCMSSVGCGLLEKSLWQSTFLWLRLLCWWLHTNLPPDLAGFYSALLSTHWLPLTFLVLCLWAYQKRAQLLRLTLFLPLSSFLLFALHSSSSLKWQRQIKMMTE